MRVRTALVAVLAAVLSGCATTYGEIGGWEQDGVSADRLSADTFRIRGRGNGSTDPAVIQDFVMLRAAETMRTHCFTHFVVLEGVDRTDVQQGVTPDEYTTVVTEQEVDGKVEKVVTRRFTPGTAWTTIRPGQDVIVRGLRPNARPAPDGAIAAEEVMAYVGPRVTRREDAPPPVFPDCPAAG